LARQGSFGSLVAFCVVVLGAPLLFGVVVDDDPALNALHTFAGWLFVKVHMSFTISAALARTTW
jgi:hypothetical protein